LKGLGLVGGYAYHWQKRDEKNEEGYSALGGVHYDLFADTRLKAAYKRDIRFPTLGDLYAPDEGNPGLSMVRSKMYEAGVEQKLPYNTLLSVTGFYTEAKDLIQKDQATRRSENIDRVDFSGIEAAISSQPLKRLLVRASYTYLHSKDKARPGDGPQQYTPGDRATLEANYRFDSGLAFYASFLYVGDQYFYTKNNVTPMRRMKLDDYSLVNMKVSQRIYDRVTLYVGANNVFDENYETSYGFPQRGRFIYGGVEFKI
jgi:outer membrane cobalamin receptor